MQRPNILWICSDQQRWDTLGCYGNPFVNTPNIDRLAAEGTCFDHAFSQSPVCTPSRGAFLTGRYPRTCRARQNGADIPDSEVLVTRMLADAGYLCGLSGKLHLRACNPRHVGADGVESRLDDGYSVFHWSHHSGSMGESQNHYWDWLAGQGTQFSAQRVEDSRTVATAMSGETSQAAWCADRAIEFMEQQAAAGRPWLFSVNLFDPHAAFDPPREFLDPYLARLEEIPLPSYREGELADKPGWQRHDHERGAYGRGANFAWRNLSERDHRLIRAAYWAMCDLIDAQVGRMLDAVARTGQRENTLIIYTSDHGEMLGDHGIYMKGPFFYDCAVRVPLIISWPGQVEARSSSALVELLDLPQTLLDAVGLEPHPGMMGASLWPLLTGAVSADAHREDVYCEFYNACDGHNGECELPAMATMVRTREHKLTVGHDVNAGELYDLRADPGEHRNLWDDPASVELKADMLVRLADRMAFTADPLPQRVAVW